MGKKVTVKKLVEEVGLEILAGKKGLNNEITDDEIIMPGLEFAGFLQYFEGKRVLLVGTKEASYLKGLGEELAYQRVREICKFNPPAFVYSRNVEVPDFLIDLGNEFNIPVLKSDLRTTPLNGKIFGYLRSQLAQKISVHGVLLDINGMGTLIIGKSAIGKSETALELIKRGHQLVADDRVDVYEKEPGIIIGQAPETIAQYIEVRGVGIINVVQMFGAAAYRENKKIRLVIELELWDKDKYYDRLGGMGNTEKYFHTELPKITIPIRPGRNNAVLVETAAMNMKLKYLGMDATKELSEKIGRITRGEE